MSALRRLLLGLLALALATGVLAVPSREAAAAPDGPPAMAGGGPILLLVDTSGSMGEDDGAGTVKLEGAKTGLLRLLNELPLETEIGLRTYPGSASGGCDSGTERIPVTRRAPATMSAEIRALTANGDTPTAEALRAAGTGLIADGFDSATIVVVSDGESTCADPCPVARDLTAQGLNVTVHAVGFALDAADPAVAELQCLADATGGTYTNAADAEALAERLSQLSAPAVAVALDTAGTFYPESQSALTVRALVSNPTQQTVLDVRVDLRFDPAASAGAPAVTAPLKLLGNFASGERREVTWTVLPTLTRTEGELAYTVRAISLGALPAEASGRIALERGLDLDHAGQLFRDAEHVLVLGDSYSSGEGAGDYDTDSSDDDGGCHRSANAYAYAYELFDPDEVTMLACSNAVTTDHWSGQADRREGLDSGAGSDLRSQRDQLDEEVEAVDLVLLTMGGNDVGFADIITNCLTGAGCDSLLLCGPGDVGEGWWALPDIVGDCDRTLPQVREAQLGALQPTLTGYYRDVLADTGDAPVVVLPYVNVVPLSDRGFNSCIIGLPGVGRGEFEQIRWLQAELNRQIGEAVESVRGQGYGDRLYFAGDVETALEPGHTICDQVPWVNPVNWWLLTGYKDKQEVVHPNELGQQAIAGALLRWSARVDPPTVADSAPTVARDWNLDGWFDTSPRIDLDDAQPAAVSVQGGGSLTLQGSGYLPGGQVQIGIQSTARTLASVTAAGDGTISATVTVPAGLTGDHVVYSIGPTGDGEVRVLAQAVTVGGPPVWGALLLSLVAVLVAVGGWFLIRYARRRRRAYHGPTGQVRSG